MKIKGKFLKKRPNETLKQTRLRRLRNLCFMLRNHSALFGPVNVKFNWDDFTTEDHTGCGTLACVCGSAKFVKEFTDEGLPKNNMDDLWENAADGFLEFFMLTYDQYEAVVFGTECHSPRLASAENFNDTPEALNEAFERVERIIRFYEDAA